MDTNDYLEAIIQKIKQLQASYQNTPPKLWEHEAIQEAHHCLNYLPENSESPLAPYRCHGQWCLQKRLGD